jgi:oligopeptide transport system ATP-binding protein
MPPLLRIENLVKTFSAGRRTLRAVDGVSLELAAGESLGIVGESGCGKSTLARCAVRLLVPTGGTVVFDGVDLATLKPEALRRKRREFQIVFQDPFGSLDPRMTVRRTLLEPLEAHALHTHPARQERVAALLASVGLDAAFASRFPRDLSGGERQRVAIARALALEPRLIIADEPVSALDTSVQAQILNLIDGIRQRFGLSLILISHDLSVVRYTCSRVAVMYLGRVVEERGSEDLFLKPLHPYTRLLLDSVPRWHGDTQPGVQPQQEKAPGSVGPGGCAFFPRCPNRMPRCASASPELSGERDSGKVACFLYT